MYADKDKKSVRTRFICVYPCAVRACFGKSLSSYVYPLILLILLCLLCIGCKPQRPHGRRNLLQNAKATNAFALFVPFRVLRDSMAGRAIVQIRGPSAETAAKVLRELIVGLESPLPESRKAAAETLGSLGANARSAVAQLKRATRDDDEGVRAAAGKALQSIRG